jgi:diguanylate cyclase (GGDEF)-like protein
MSRVARRLGGAGTATVLALCLTGLVAYVDYASGRELNVEPLYFVPVSIAAWHAGITSAAVLAAVSATTWQVANQAAGLTYSRPELWLANMGTQLLACALVGLLIAYLRQRVEREEWSSRHDALTGLPNARAFYERADQELARARRHGGPMTAAYIDLDNFKSLNDRLGHKAGDAALRTVASLLRRSARATDVTARLGGDEFVVLMPDTDAAGARAVLERLRSELELALSERTSLFGKRGEPSASAVSASIGAVSFVDLPETVDQLLGAADDRMYAVKRAGKNLVRVDECGHEGRLSIAHPVRIP